MKSSFSSYFKAIKSTTTSSGSDSPKTQKTSKQKTGGGGGSGTKQEKRKSDFAISEESVAQVNPLPLPFPPFT